MYMQWTTSKSIKKWDKLRMKMKSSQRQKQHKSMIKWIIKKDFNSTIKSKIMENINKRYEEDEDVNVENLIPDLPLELQREVKRHICLPLLKNVSFITSINLLNNCIINFINNNMKKENNFINKLSVLWSHKQAEAARMACFFFFFLFIFLWIRWDIFEILILRATYSILNIILNFFFGTSFKCMLYGYMMGLKYLLDRYEFYKKF